MKPTFTDGWRAGACGRCGPPPVVAFSHVRIQLCERTSFHCFVLGHVGLWHSCVCVSRTRVRLRRRPRQACIAHGARHSTRLVLVHGSGCEGAAFHRVCMRARMWRRHVFAHAIVNFGACIALDKVSQKVTDARIVLGGATNKLRLGQRARLSHRIVHPHGRCSCARNGAVGGLLELSPSRSCVGRSLGRGALLVLSPLRMAQTSLALSSSNGCGEARERERGRAWGGRF